MKKRLVHISGSDFIKGILDSQSIIMMQYLNKVGWQTNMVSFIEYNDIDHDIIKTRTRDIESRINGHLILIPRLPIISGMKRYNKLLSQAFNKLGIMPNDQIIVHAENYLPSYLMLNFNNQFPGLKLHADLKGAVPQESLWYDNRHFPSRLIRYVVSNIMEKSIC